jgi:hypothetical protein
MRCGMVDICQRGMDWQSLEKVKSHTAAIQPYVFLSRNGSKFLTFISYMFLSRNGSKFLTFIFLLQTFEKDTLDKFKY